MPINPDRKRHFRKDKGMGTQDVSVVLGRMLKQSGLAKRFDHSYELKLLNCWSDVVGEGVASQVKLIDIKNGTLLLKTNSPVWKNEINLQKKAIFQRANEMLGKKLIYNLRFL